MPPSPLAHQVPPPSAPPRRGAEPPQSTWTAHLARRTYTLHHGARAAEAAPGTYLGVLNSIATSAYRGIMVGTSVALSFVLNVLATTLIGYKAWSVSHSPAPTLRIISAITVQDSDVVLYWY